MVGTEFRGVGHAKVAAEDVDALPAAQAGGFVGDADHRVDAGDTDRNLAGPELRGGRAEAFVEAALSDVALAAVGDDRTTTAPTPPATVRASLVRSIG
jgi:hypothetical protein